MTKKTKLDKYEQAIEKSLSSGNFKQVKNYAAEKNKLTMAAENTLNKMRSINT